jgi:hypothetical protein
VLENWELGASYECIIDIYKKELCGFLPFWFPRKFKYSVSVVVCHALMNDTIYDEMIY